MIIYNLTRNNSIIPEKSLRLKLFYHENLELFISDSLYFFLTKGKQRIDNNVNEWDNYKKITNPYEFIHTPIHNNTRSVSSYEAVSRSFFKMIEIVNFYNILEQFNHRSIKTFHLAEGPGGFIEAMMFLRNNTEDVYHGMTLINDNRNVPRWTKLQNKFRFNSRIKYEYGASGNGDLLNVENLEYCFNKYGNSMDMLTGDGGFDFSVNYEKQEASSTKLVMAQIMYAVLLQKKNGTFILKIFDIFRKPTTQLIFLLNSLYENVSICKPKTSRFANSEKYIVCKNFKLENSSVYLDAFKRILTSFEDKGKHIHSIFNFDIPLKFMNEIEELNCILGKKQLNTIHSTLMMIQEKRTDKIDKFTKLNVNKCIEWCKNNNVPYHTKNNQKNIFTSVKTGL
jgi:23S rRNA U2552 (ribose-2'-O)-methylase RlmE/FtsJ